MEETLFLRGKNHIIRELYRAGPGLMVSVDCGTIRLWETHAPLQFRQEREAGLVTVSSWPVRSRSIHDRLGPDFTLVDFTLDGVYAKEFNRAIPQVKSRLTVVHLPQETTARKLWERSAVLVRPDMHVAWRSGETEGPWSKEGTERVLKSCLGY